MIERQAEQYPAEGPGLARPSTWRERLVTPAVLVFGLGLVALTGLFLGGSLPSEDTKNTVALISLVAVVAVFLVDATAGLLLWIVLAPFSRLFILIMGRGLPNFSLSRVAFLILALILVTQLAAGKRRLLRPGPIEICGLLYVLGMLASVPASRLGLVSGIQNVFDTVFVPLACFTFARNMIRKEADLQRLSAAVAIVGATLGAIAIWEQITHIPVLSSTSGGAYGRYSIKVMSLFSAPATMAMTLVMPLPLTLVNALRARGLDRLPWVLAVAAIIGGLLLTYVRAGWLAAIAGLLIVTALSPSVRSHAKFIVVLVALVGLIAVTGTVEFRAVTERLEAEGSINYREDALRVGLELARVSPLFGLGLDNFSDAALASGWRPVGALGIPVIAPHNLFIYIMISAGLLGLVPFLLYLGAMALRGWRLWRRVPRRWQDWPAAVLATVVAYAAFANTYDALVAQVASMLLAVIAGALLSTTEAAQGRLAS